MCHMAVCCKDVVSTQDETFIRMTELEDTHTHTHTHTYIHTHTNKQTYTHSVYPYLMVEVKQNPL